MSLEAIENLARDPAPGFWCDGRSAFGPVGERFLIRVRHSLNAPATPECLAEIDRLLGAAAIQVQAFYRRHDGFELYQSTVTGTAAIELLPVRRWGEATEMMQGCFEHLSPEEDPDCILSGVAVGEVPQSGNYFVIPVLGPQVGKTFYVPHDGWYEAPFAQDFDEFLKRVTNQPGKLISTELGGYTCYSDGQSAVQWSPIEYVADIRE